MLNILSAILLLVSPAYFGPDGEWIPFNGEKGQRAPEVNLLSSTPLSVSIACNTYGVEWKEVETDWMIDTKGETFAVLSTSPYTYTGEIGKPKLPMLTGVIEIPHNARLNVTVVRAEFKEVSLYDLGITNRIMPALESVPKIKGARPIFVLDDVTYSKDAFYPDKIYSVDISEGFARGHRLAQIHLFPVQYNPVTGRLRYYTEIQVRVDFVGGDIKKTKETIARNYSSVWEDYIRKIVLNYEYGKGLLPLPIYYDIYYNSAFSSAADSLAYWKKKKGFNVRIFDATGWTAAAIDDTIEAQTPVATYVAVIADPNAATPLPPSATGGASGQSTDLYYAEIDGTGYLPDLYNARISVKTAAEANTAIQKAISYEHANFGSAGTAWLKRACLIAGYDASFQDVGMATNWYCRNLLVPCGYTVDTLVIASGEDARARVRNQINNGRAWTVYTAHGGEDCWALNGTGTNAFDITEVNNLTNQDMYTMPCGHCCVANKFDYTSDCFGVLTVIF